MYLRNSVVIAFWKTGRTLVQIDERVIIIKMST
jgi:hypothetical protein